MPIVPSRARRIQELIRGLGSERAAERESAVARLTLLGPRVVEALLRALPTAGAGTRLAALEVLERLREARALPEIVALAQSADTQVAKRALEVLGSFPVAKSTAALARVLESAPVPLRRAAAHSLVRLQAAGMVEATDPLLDLLMDEREDDELRLFVLDSLAALDPPLDPRTLAPLLRRLQGSADATVADRAAALAARGRESRAGDSVAPLRERLRVEGPFAAGRRGDGPEPLSPADLERIERELERTSDPASVRLLADTLGRGGGASSIPVLARALERLSRPDDDERIQAARAMAKGRVHIALAALDSRLALFDLREMLQARPVRALPPLLEAAAKVGDASLVPALAGLAAESPALMDLCAGPFASIVRRARLRPTSAALKAVRPPHREALRELWERSARSGKTSPRAGAGRKAPRKG
jgi:HEAT repeats